VYSLLLANWRHSREYLQNTDSHRSSTDVQFSEAADVTGKASAAITNLIKNSAESTNDIISQLIGAVFGRQGQSQDMIPQTMRRGEVSSTRKPVSTPV
jgi:CO/xanthine dehydrogenase Mo-binding subunit